MLHARILAAALICVAIGVDVRAEDAEDFVYGPPKLLIEGRIEKVDGSGRSFSFFRASFLNWNEMRQTWPSSTSVASTTARGRVILGLQSEPFDAEVRVLRFSTLGGRRLDAEAIPAILESGRAVAFLEKGCRIHPAIAAALHPETLVVTQASYPDDPVVVPLPEDR